MVRTLNPDYVIPYSPNPITLQDDAMSYASANNLLNRLYKYYKKKLIPFNEACKIRKIALDGDIMMAGRMIEYALSKVD